MNIFLADGIFFVIFFPRDGNFSKKMIEHLRNAIKHHLNRRHPQKGKYWDKNQPVALFLGLGSYFIAFNKVHAVIKTNLGDNLEGIVCLGKVVEEILPQLAYRGL